MYPKSALTPPEPKLKTQAQMMELLKTRVAGASGVSPKLSWNKPVRQENGSGSQTAAGTDYVIRKALTKDTWLYWAWHANKLLGYSADLEIAKAHCEAHHMGNTK
jgi:hypothetical protein